MEGPKWPYFLRPCTIFLPYLNGSNLVESLLSTISNFTEITLAHFLLDLKQCESMSHGRGVCFLKVIQCVCGFGSFFYGLFAHFLCGMNLD